MSFEPRITRISRMKTRTKTETEFGLMMTEPTAIATGFDLAPPAVESLIQNQIPTFFIRVIRVIRG